MVLLLLTCFYNIFILIIINITTDYHNINKRKRSFIAEKIQQFLIPTEQGHSKKGQIVYKLLYNKHL